MYVKLCYRCGKHKPLDDFHVQAATQDGRKTQCKTCTCAYQVAYGANHRKERNAYAQKYYTLNKPRLQASARNRMRAIRAGIISPKGRM